MRLDCAKRSFTVFTQIFIRRKTVGKLLAFPGLEETCRKPLVLASS
jgi:hypothetical protein